MAFDRRSDERDNHATATWQVVVAVMHVWMSLSYLGGAGRDALTVRAASLPVRTYLCTSVRGRSDVGVTGVRVSLARLVRYVFIGLYPICHGISILCSIRVAPRAASPDTSSKGKV